MSRTLCERLKEAVSAALNSKRTQGMIAQIKLQNLRPGEPIILAQIVSSRLPTR
jgi:hypothetical protein